jgi:hypothetical protein
MEGVGCLKMIVRIELSEKDLVRLVKGDISKMTCRDVDMSKIKIQVKSKQNYKSEWEEAEFRAVYESN